LHTFPLSKLPHYSFHQIRRPEKLEVEKRRKEVIQQKEGLQKQLDEAIEVVAVNSKVRL
jgi:hypothetical protein